MNNTYNIYCDESGHLEHGTPLVMVLGAIWCPMEKTREITCRIREISERNGMSPNFEIKWGKVSSAKTQFYLDLVDYFFDDDDLHFRALVIPDKTQLQHERFKQKHDEWYYKMYFTMLNVIIDPGLHYRIYLDIKDTRSTDKVQHLHTVLSNKNYDFSRTIIERIQNVRSNEVKILQVADLFIGAVSYANRHLSDNAGKVAIVERIRERSKYTLTRSTFPRENKVNIFIWKPNRGNV
ncbi:DUF3800 domain-containing protein [Candidatus Oscillochloris fontis]|uniref:DUF3800 domain-containing protein n=1 Tax=Candidatus Oscillochloris fontis TaxID=2496868 RepID=UPI00101B6D3A|nr:DUF3800 domain-containing protein [Candidatus Oscillochloris fontis]